MPRPPLLVVTISSREFSEYLLWADMYLSLHQAGIIPVSLDTTVGSIPVHDIVDEADGLILPRLSRLAALNPPGFEWLSGGQQHPSPGNRLCGT